MKSPTYYLIKIFLITMLITVYTGCIESSKSNKNNVDIPEKPNVVFIICDDLNDYSGAFSGHSQVKTTNIDKLAKSGQGFHLSMLTAMHLFVLRQGTVCLPVFILTDRKILVGQSILNNRY